MPAVVSGSDGGGETRLSVAGVASMSPSALADAGIALDASALSTAALAFSNAFVSFARMAMPFLIVRKAFQPRMATRKTMIAIAGSSLLSSTPKTTPSSSPLCMNVLAS